MDRPVNFSGCNRGMVVMYVEKVDDQLIWHLKPGDINTIAAAFFVPNYLGIGTIVIVLITVFAYYLKYKRLPGVSPST